MILLVSVRGSQVMRLQLRLDFIVEITADFANGDGATSAMARPALFRRCDRRVKGMVMLATTLWHGVRRVIPAQAYFAT